MPADYVPGDPRRARMVAAAEAAGFGAVELVYEALAAVAIGLPGPQPRPGELLLVCDFGATFVATLVLVGANVDEVVGHQSIVDPGLSGGDALFGQPTGNASPAVEHTIACCHDLLARLKVNSAAISGLIPIGAGARTPGLDLALHRSLGIPIRQVDEPELVVVRGAAAWLARSGPRTIAARTAPGRVVPLAFAIPGGSGTLLRWLVAPQESYGEGTALARIRLAGGAVWELTANGGGVLDRVLVADGATVAAGDWLALARL